jgi:branched-chain amino acid transport system substrate-binding protein
VRPTYRLYPGWVICVNLSLGRGSRTLGAAHVVAGLAGVALLASACGSSGGGSATTGGGGSGTTKSQITIGLVTSETGPLAASAAGGRDLATGWATWVNKTQGGINGHPVKVDVVDDASDPATGASRARQLVEQDHVIAVVGSYATASTATFAPYLQQRKIANINAAPNQPVWTQNPVFFPVSMTVPDSVIAKAKVAQVAGAKKWGAFVCAESPACDVSSIWSAVSPKLGLDYVGAQKVAASAPSYATECLKFKQEGVGYVQVGLPSQVTLRAIRDCQQQGFNPTWGIQSSAWDPALLSIPGLKVDGDSYTLPWFSDQPALADYKQLENTYVKEASWRSFTSLASFAALEVFRKAMAGVGAHPTAADVLTAMAALHGESLGGLLPSPVGGFNAGTAAQPALKCFYRVGIQGGKYVSPDGAKPTCVDVTL